MEAVPYAGTDKGGVVGGGQSGAAYGLAPLTRWSEMCEHDHFVQFYEADDFLTDSLAAFVKAGTEAGEACVVVAKSSRRAELERRMSAGGLDVEALAASGRYVAHDAEGLLPRLKSGGVLDRALALRVLGEVLGAASRGGERRVRVFGEMVALLWEAGECEEAIRLETIWNEVRAEHACQLFCAYPMSVFGGEAHAEPLARVCAGHTRVIPAESYTSLADESERLRAVALLQQQARSLQREIAERKEAEEALRAALEERERLLASEHAARTEAEHANRLKDEFLATVSHELRTPLTAIVGWSHMLRHSSLDEATAAHGLETIERNAHAQARLVEDILDVSRVVTGKLKLKTARVDAAAVVDAAVESVRHAAETKGIVLEVSHDPSARYVTGDSGRLQQVVWNLLSNAIKFTPAGGRVEVRTEHAGTDALIRVSDTGCGIAPDFLPHLFGRFRQADGSTTRCHGGLGLGLAIVRHLVELHGGTVRAESEGEGLGSTFTVRLPLAARGSEARGLAVETAAPEPRDSSRGEEASAASLEGARVLLVDDDEDTLRMLAQLLGEYGAEVRTAGDAAAALDALPGFRPDVLVSDLVMQGEDGYTLIDKVRRLSDEDGRHTPAVALTAYVEDRARVLASGFNHFVPKPVEPVELVRAVAALAERKSSDL